MKELTLNDEQENFELLKNAIMSAMRQDQHIIYCNCDNLDVIDIPEERILNLFDELSEEGIYMLLVNVDCEERSPVNVNYDICFGISKIISFVITQPLYKPILSAIENGSLTKQISWLKFLKTICPHSFGISESKITNDFKYKFRIISPFWNIAPYIKDYYHSIVKQNYTNYSVYLIDDCSTDGGISQLPKNRKFKNVINSTRKFALKNIIETLKNSEFKDDDIICLVDGDDCLSTKFTLDILNNIYGLNASTYLTYGGMRLFHGLQKYGSSYSLSEFSNLRNEDWKISHMRTFRYRLFKEFMIQDPNLLSLTGTNGEIFRTPADMALLFPLIEIAGFKRVRYLDTVLYDYRLHGNNVHVINRDLQKSGEEEIRLKRKFTQKKNRPTKCSDSCLQKQFI